MKKRTVITTEKREVWVIRPAGATMETGRQSQPDAAGDEIQALTTIEQDHPDDKPTEEQK